MPEEPELVALRQLIAALRDALDDCHAQIGHNEWLELQPETVDTMSKNHEFLWHWSDL